MPAPIGLDFETYSAVDLPKHGLARYVGHHTFRPLIASVARENHPTQTVEFITDPGAAAHQLSSLIGDATIVAHNAAFEQAVLDRLGLFYGSESFIDSAVVARAAGAAGRLEAAAPQLLDTDKLESGKNLMRLFSIPPKDAGPDAQFDVNLITDNYDDWLEYIHYCEVDAELGLRIVQMWDHVLAPHELAYQDVTMDMNKVGWRVDIPLVAEMQRRYHANMDQTLQEFRDMYDAQELNLNSLKQLKEWCEERGIKATSFDEKNVAKLLARIEQKLLSSAKLTQDKRDDYLAVRDLLRTKQALGGSSLKKLQVILDTANGERLLDQYLHCGAGQTLRTTGRSVQMQNLKRLSTIEDMDTLHDPAVHWDNTQLAENLRQVFTASKPGGSLVVGDFSSVESRGLAWLAHEDWKLDAYRKGQDLYKTLASNMFGVAYDAVSKEQRQIGKVGELSCGYGAGPGAVMTFAENMGVNLTEGEATKLVYDWRDANPNIVALWDRLNDMLIDVVEGHAGQTRWELSDGLTIVLTSHHPPASLQKINPHAVTVKLSVVGQSAPILNRYFHGCHRRGRNVVYYKPSELKTGELWKDTFIDPKTKHRRHHELYGGKLAGILTQSFCRELFFESLLAVHEEFKRNGNVRLVGQFHDEIVLDVDHPPILDRVKKRLGELMSHSDIAPSFPLEAEIKHDYRYTK
jgi:DNA polymerase bacteriophage-type